MPKSPETVTITLPMSRLIELLEAERDMARLDAGGVDNWTWFDDSISGADALDWPEIENMVAGLIAT
jgi:hypothetical protein